MDGIIVVNKPGGVSSHGVVHSVRKIFPGIKAGHSGTLDPMATGVLPICLGRATRVVEYIIELPKIYQASVILGKTTDTEDATGSVIEESLVPGLERSEIDAIINQFTGTIEQLPPFYSAVKYRGKPLYQWTRKGETVPRKVRSAEIYSIELLEYNCDREPHIVFNVHCSRGTYIRTLAVDIGKVIGCGAYLSALVRTAVGPYTLVNSFTPLEILEKVNLNLGNEVILGMDSALLYLPLIILNEEQVEALKYGQMIIPDQLELPGNLPGNIPIRIYDQQGNFKAIARREKTADSVVGLKTVKYLS